MRCYCCGNILTTPESTRKFRESGTYTEMCNKCLETIDVETIEGFGVSEGEECFDDDGNPMYEE